MQNVPLFELNEVCFAYEGQLPALDGISLAIQAGQRVAVFGSNGSGKGTLIQLLDGLYFPTAGSVRYCAQPLTEAGFQDEAFNFDFRRRVGLVFQDTDVQLFSPSV